jgi:hypothetical protein
MSVRTAAGRLSVLLGFLMIAAGCEGENAFPVAPMKHSDAGQLGGRLEGMVTSIGVPVGGVRVFLVDSDVAYTDTRGVYQFRGLPPRTYSVAVQVPSGYALAPGEEGMKMVVVPRNGTGVANFRLEPIRGAP